MNISIFRGTKCCLETGAGGAYRAVQSAWPNIPRRAAAAQQLWACVFLSLRERIIAPGSRDAPCRWGGDFPSGPETHAHVNAEPSSNPWNTKRGLRNEWAQAPRRSAIYENEAGGLPGRRFPQVKLRGAHGGADQRASFPELIPGRRHHEMPGPGSRGAAVETLPSGWWGWPRSSTRHQEGRALTP